MKIDWVTHTIPNPSRAWWQFFKPKRIKFAALCISYRNTGDGA